MTLPETWRIAHRSWLLEQVSVDGETLRSSDEIWGPLRIVEKPSGLWVVGDGGSTPVADEAEGRKLIDGAYRTGRYTAEAKAERREQRALMRELRRLIALADE